MDRRRDRIAQSPIETLKHLPALVVLERLLVPVLAIGPDGAILFANAAAAAMLGYPAGALGEMNFQQIFHPMPADESAVAAVRAYEDLIVALRHSDGSTVRAKMSKSALRRNDDQVVLVV